MPPRCSGAATVEHVGLVALIALAFAATLAALAAGGAPPRPAAELAQAIQRHIRCPAALPGPCWRDPLAAAYGRPLAGAIRALAPAPAALPGPSGEPLVPVDFRDCRSASCAAPGPSPAHLTASGRRVTEFTSVDDRRRSGGGVEITYWLYRPGLGWSRALREASAAGVRALASTPLREDADPRLVPLETLAGRNHYDFAPGEEPPWRWRVASVYP